MVVFLYTDRRCEFAWSHSPSHAEWLEVILINKTAESSAAKPCYEHYFSSFILAIKGHFCRMTFFFLQRGLYLVIILSFNF